MSVSGQISARDIVKGVKSSQFSVRDVAEVFCDRVDLLKSKLNTHLHWDRAQVLAEADRQQGRLRSEGHEMPLAGVPIVVKDNLCTIDAPTTCASRMLTNFRPPYDATVITKLRSAGAVIFGKTNMDEFAMGSSNENSAFGPVRNPWNLNTVPGGSSGGSAAAVAARMAPIGLGSDTGGSIRQPASFCGVVGLKPTYGSISRYGLIAFASSLDQIGPIGANVYDVALAMETLGGHDSRDSTSKPHSFRGLTAALSSEASKGVKGLRVGVVRELMGEGVDPEVGKAVQKAIDLFSAGGATVHEVSLQSLRHSTSTYYVIATAEASSNLARYDGIVFGHRTKTPVENLAQLYSKSRSEGFGAEVKRRIMLGTYVLSAGYYDAYYGKANHIRSVLRSEFESSFSSCDVLLSPTSPTTAFKIGEKVSDPVAMYLSDICTIGANLAGIPAISLNCGFDAAGLPIGLQLMGPMFSEAALLRGAHWYEQNSSHNSRQIDI